jgi:RHS repeat-associated protein
VEFYATGAVLKGTTASCGNGSRGALTEKGEIAWRGKQQLWGREEGVNKDSAPACRLRFPGQYEDAESGLYYNRFRYYDCGTGQYISADPLGLAGGINPYGYVPNPLGCIDPLGLKCSGPADKLNRKLSALEKAQRKAVNIRKLSDGRMRYYDAEAFARTPEPIRGRSHVTEWNPKTGDVRIWGGTYNHSGQVNRVHPKMKNGELLDLPHYPPTKADMDAGIATPSGRSVPFNLRGLL